MDSDEDNSRCQRENDMDQMRAGSASPSTISTASSGSPLVRGHSSSSTGKVGSATGALRRPAPTSIAAAQLQCQQQQQSVLSTSPLKSSASSASPNGSVGNKPEGLGQPEKQPKQQQKAKKHEESNNKSFGYNVAKSIAHRAYRFNEFWTLDKMSYLNLACLLMTLLCLITIVLFSTSTGNDQQQQQQQPLGRSTRLGSLDSPPASGATTRTEFDQEAEPVPEPSGHSLRDDSLFDDYGASASGQPDDQATDYPDTENWPTRRPASKLRRKSGPEREIEDSPASDQQQQAAGASNEATAEREGPLMAGGSLLEPLLGQIFKDLELGSILKAALNGTNSSKQLRPIIRRSNNGATIVISSTFNESSLANNSANPIPSLFEKLLPPMLFRHRNDHQLSSSGGGSKLGDNLAGSATITISGRAIEPAGVASELQGLFPMLSGLAAPRPFRAFFPAESMATIRMGPPLPRASQFAAVPYPSALGMILRSMASDAEEEQFSTPNKLAPQPSDRPAKSANSSEPMSAQASQQKATTVDSKQVASNNNSTLASNTTTISDQQQQNVTELDPEVETFDVSQMLPFRLAARPSRVSRISLLSPPSQSVMIIGSGSAASEPFGLAAGGLQGGGPFAAGLPVPMPVMPHMMMLAGESDGGSGPLVGSGWPPGAAGPMPVPFNPIMRAILGNLAGLGSSSSSLSPSSDANEKNKTKTGGRVDRAATTTIRVIKPIFNPFETMEMSQPDDLLVDDRQMRARHRMDMMLNEMVDQASSPEQSTSSQDFIQDNQQHPSLFEQALIGRQPIRGPAFAVGQIPNSEVTSQAAATASQPSRPQQVPRGVRSQSISKLAEDDDGDEQQQAVSSSSNKLASTGRRARLSTGGIDRRDDATMSEGLLGLVPARMNFIGRLLSDLSRRSTGPRVLLSRSDLEDQMVDDSAEARPDQVASAQPWPPVPRPSFAESEPLFLSPLSAHQQQQQAQMGEQDGSFPETTGGEMSGKQQVSLEDTLNSMEDRLDKVLSMATQQHTSAPLTHRAIITPVERPKLTDHTSDNPYTSPSSPLFGFPAPSSIAAETQAPGEDKKGSNSMTSSREPRSFTYHSNNELASNLKLKLAAQQREQEQRETETAEMRAESIGRASKFGPFLSPPAGAMGRRLDDGPFEGDSPSSTDEQQQQQESAASSLATSRASRPTFLEGRAMMPITLEGHDNKRPAMANANNEAGKFRTIVV